MLATPVLVRSFPKLGPTTWNAPSIFASHTLGRAERKYFTTFTTHKELLAVVWAPKTFRPYLPDAPFVLTTSPWANFEFHVHFGFFEVAAIFFNQCIVLDLLNRNPFVGRRQRCPKLSFRRFFSFTV